jgi:hypothetical protein
MSDADDKIIKLLEELRDDVHILKEGQKILEAGQKVVEFGQKTLEAGQQAVQADLQKQGTQIEKQGHTLTQHGNILGGLAANMATVLEEQQAQRTDIRSLHTEVHASREELKGEIHEARVEARADSIDLKAEVTKPIKDYGKRIHALEDAADIPHPDKN